MVYILLLFAKLKSEDFDLLNSIVSLATVWRGVKVDKWSFLKRVKKTWSIWISGKPKTSILRCLHIMVYEDMKITDLICHHLPYRVIMCQWIKPDWKSLGMRLKLNQSCWACYKYDNISKLKLLNFTKLNQIIIIVYIFWHFNIFWWVSILLLQFWHDI